MSDRMGKFRELRDWCYGSGEPWWISDAFAHWCVEELSDQELSGVSSFLKQMFNYDTEARRYYQAHGARLITDEGQWEWPEPLRAVVRPDGEAAT